MKISYRQRTNLTSSCSCSGLWETNLVDTTKSLRWYFQECVDAGAERCALHESSVDRVEARYNQLLSKLKVAPIAVKALDPSASVVDYGVVDYGVTLSIVFQFLYNPYGTDGRAAALAAALAAAETGDGRPLWDLQTDNIIQFACKCPSTPTPQGLSYSADAAAAISCGDAEVVRASPQDLQDWYDRVGRDSEFAAVWSSYITCTYVLRLTINSQRAALLNPL